MYNIDKIRELSQNEGLNDREIAELLHCDRTTVTRTRKRENIPICNKNNRKDKKYICSKCKKIIYIRRCEPIKLLCPECEKHIQIDEEL